MNYIFGTRSKVNLDAKEPTQHGKAQGQLKESITFWVLMSYLAAINIFAWRVIFDFLK